MCPMLYFVGGKGSFRGGVSFLHELEIVCCMCFLKIEMIVVSDQISDLNDNIAISLVL